MGAESPSPHRIQAKRLVGRRTEFGTSRREATARGKIASVGTARDFESTIALYLEWRHVQNLPLGQQDNRLQLGSFLEERSEMVRQATLNQNRNALSRVYGIALPPVRSSIETMLTTRSYAPVDVLSILDHQTATNGLATAVAFQAGLRGHELTTLRRANESRASPHRVWDERRFIGVVDPAIFIVTGKGGLRREIALSRTLAQQLETLRLDQPRPVRDRGINYQMHYAIGFGQAFSQSFSDASRRTLGYSTGAHGLRHSYAKERTATLLRCGLPFSDAQLIVSQELGHFRADITLAYYR